ncbi:type II secretion system protein GspL [Chitinolyticbacter meiyuanensis]|uniref:type II secretion system protein GspL n=1 Tax=Chitinolyticbacter meiyuanensis TaxID=682798 RepID=UPI0016526156|nr:type II secretion system protein GspL [Chitinolyticbacter meiyuanensis]
MSTAPSSPLLRLVLDGPVAEATTLTWLTPAGGALDSGRGTVADLPSAAHLALLIPPTRLSQHVVALPKQPPARLRALLPLALEDRLLAPAASQWFGLHPLGDGQWRVQVVERAWLAGWIELLRTHGHVVDGAYALSDLIETTPGTWQQLTLPDGNVLLLDPGGEAVCPPPDLVATLVGQTPVATLAIEALAAVLLPEHNLLQAEFAPRPAWQFDWKAWRRPAVLAGALLILLTVLNIADWWQLSRRAEALKREMRQTFAAALPGVPVVDPVLQLQSRLREAGVNEGGNAGGDRLAGLLRRLDQTGGALQLDALRYTDGQLELAIKGDATAVKSQLDAAGIPAQLAQGSSGPLLRVQAQP